MLRRLSPAKAVIVIPVLALVIFMLMLVSYSRFGSGIVATEETVWEVKRGDTLTRTVHRMAKAGLVDNPGPLVLLGILRGDAGDIKAGRYLFQPGMSPGELLDAMITGSGQKVGLTIPEGWSLAEVAQRVEASQLGSAKGFLSLARDPVFIASLKLPFPDKPTSLEGFLLPETYFFSPQAGEAKVLRTAVEVFKERAAPMLQQGAGKVGLTPYQAMVLASVVEKETGAAHERPMIAGVFHNRLRSNMRLDSDPTVIYGIKNFDGNLTRRHLRTPTPYNTYRMKGLPPTPITNPGMAAFKAVLDPAPVEYLFFVGKGDGTHFFSKDLKTHEAAVIKYQVRPARRGN